MVILGHMLEEYVGRIPALRSETSKLNSSLSIFAALLQTRNNCIGLIQTGDLYLLSVPSEKKHHLIDLYNDLYYRVQKDYHSDSLLRELHSLVPFQPVLLWLVRFITQ